MPLQYYPSFTIKTNLSTSGNQYILEGKPYVGKYYITQFGQAFSGPDPETGPNELLSVRINNVSVPGLNNPNIKLTDSQKSRLVVETGVDPSRVQGKPTYYYPQPTDQDYIRGYIIRYFTKKENETMVMEISEEEYNSIVNGTADYDIRIYQTEKILWKITGPLNSQRKSQYNVIPGIIDTNKRLTEEANKTFLGILDYIGGDYTKFARPTA